jgi:hypothetical protein
MLSDLMKVILDANKPEEVSARATVEVICLAWGLKPKPLKTRRW